MKTTIDLPDPLFRQVKASAAQRGISLKSFITQAVEQSIAAANPGRSWTELLATLPKVPAATLATVNQRVAEADATDLKHQNHPQS